MKLVLKDPVVVRNSVPKRLGLLMVPSGVSKSLQKDSCGSENHLRVSNANRTVTGSRASAKTASLRNSKPHQHEWNWYSLMVKSLDWFVVCQMCKKVAITTSACPRLIFGWLPERGGLTSVDTDEDRRSEGFRRLDVARPKGYCQSYDGQAREELSERSYTGTVPYVSIQELKSQNK
jgi:hypothetical protein